MKLLTLVILILLAFVIYMANVKNKKSNSFKVNEKKVYLIRGNKIKSLNDFYNEISQVLIPGATWGKNLDAFNDILRGGFGTPNEGFIIIWENSNDSKTALGAEETILKLEETLKKCHPSNIPAINQKIVDLKNGKGKTLFDTICEIVKTHGVDGSESEDKIELILK